MNQTKSRYLSRLGLSLALLAARVAIADVVTLQPVDDAHLINSGDLANQTWNQSTLEQFGYSAGIKRPLLKFNLSSIPDGATVTSAQLTLQQTGHYGGDGYSTALSRMTNDNWFETNVTWNSYGQAGAVIVATLPFDNGSLRTWDINLITWVYAEDLADNAVTFMLRWYQDIYGGTETDGVYKSRNYSSKEGSASPTLRIEYTVGAPEPPRLTVTASNNAMTVSWPLPAEGWVLEWTNSLRQVSALWPQVPPPYETNGAKLQFSEPSPAGNKFFRLRKP